MLQASRIYKAVRTWTVVAIGGVSTFSTASAQTQTPDHAAAYYHYSLGHMYADLASINGSPEYIRKAIENYKLAIKDDPQTPMLSEELSELYIQTGRLREAQSDAEEALKANPNDVNAHRMLGRLHKVAQNSVEAQNAYKKALEVDPDNEDALTGLAMVYADLGDNTAAADLLKKLTTKNPTPRSLQALAASYEQMHEYALAAETLKLTLELSPPNAAEIKRFMAADLRRAQQYDAALKA